MKNSLTSAARFALAATLCALSPMAEAQVIRIGINNAAPLAPVPPAYSCVALSTVPLPNTQSAFFDAQASGASGLVWKLEGDYTLVGALTANPVQFKPTGYGKVRVTASYYKQTATGTGSGTVTCGTNPPCPYNYTYPINSFFTTSTEYFKIFPNTLWAIKGPTCLPANNPSVVYSVDPALISTPAQIQSGVGIDTYQWTVTYTAGGSVPFTPTADGSTIILQGEEPTKTSVLTGSFKVKVRVGKCNTLTTDPKEITVNVATPVANAVTLNTLPCRAIGTTTNAGFTLATQLGVTYTLTTTGGLTLQSSGAGPFQPTLTIPSTTPSGSTPIAVSGITNSGIGSVIVTAAGNTSTCFGNQTVTLPLTRALSGSNTITPTCVPAGINTFTLSNAPLGQDVQYSVTGTGWSINGASITNTGTVSVNVGAGNGSITATPQTPTGGTCAAITTSVTVRSDLGCNPTYTMSRVNTRTFILNGSATCAPDEATTVPVEGITYDWTAAAQTRQTDGPTVIFGATVPPGTFVSVIITDPSQCLLGNYGQLMRLAPQPPTGGQPVVVRDVLDATDRLLAFPSPADGSLNVAFTEQRGEVVLTLLDATGRELLRQAAAEANVRLDVRQLPEGQYLLRALLPNGKALTQRVQVRH